MGMPHVLETESMHENNDPLKWDIPNWHKDLGEPRIEIEALRSFAIALCSAIAGANVRLEIPEPGLIDVKVELPNGVLAEVFYVKSIDQAEKNQYALFVHPGTESEIEVYKDSIDSAVEAFTRLLEPVS